MGKLENAGIKQKKACKGKKSIWRVGLQINAPAAERRMIMKIRITIMTENNKHLDEKYSKELIEQKAKDGWDFALKALALLSEKNETASVESCELVER